MTGSEFLKQFDPAKLWMAQGGSARALAEILKGNVPGWLRTQAWPTIAIRENGHILRMRVAPNFFAIGTDTDYAIVPLTPSDAQTAVDSFHAVLPTRKVAREIWRQALRRVPLSDAKGKPTLIPQAAIETARAVAAATQIDRINIPAFAANNGIIDGQRKNVIVLPGLDGSHVAIFGGQFLDGKTHGYDGKGKGTAQTPAHPEDFVFVQPSSTIHVASYGDDTHGARAVWRTAELDGASVDLVDDVAKNPALASLVLDLDQFPVGEKTFYWHFPNKGFVGAAPPKSGGGAPKPLPVAGGGGGSGGGVTTGGGAGTTAGDDAALASLGIVAVLGLVGLFLAVKE